MFHYYERVRGNITRGNRKEEQRYVGSKRDETKYVKGE